MHLTKKGMVITMKKRLLLLALTMVLATSTLACNLKKLTKYEARFLEVFNTITEVIAYSHDKEDFEKFAQLIYDNLKVYHQLYDKYKEYDGINNIKTINDNAGISPVKVDKRIIDLLLFCKDAYNISNGKVNIAMGSVLKIWHDYRTAGIENPESAQLPPMETLVEANNHTDINRIIIDVEASTVYLDDPFMSLDVGAIAKGYATEQVAQLAIKEGYNNFLLSVGGNVRASGYKSEEKELWRVGIQNPDTSSEQKSIYTLNITDLSLVSSGDYERYYTVDGQRYHHIIDPDTLMPANYFSAVSILCQDSGMADLLSTAIFSMPYQQGKSLIDALDQVEAIWIYPNGDVKFSDSFQDYIN